MGRPPSGVGSRAYMQGLAISKGWCMLALGGRTMDFGFTPEQEQLRAQVRRVLDKELPLERILALSAKPHAFDRGLWTRLAELGWPGITVPETYGGLGLGCEDLI